jgi:hypothetical protein
MRVLRLIALGLRRFVTLLRNKVEDALLEFHFSS